MRVVEIETATTDASRAKQPANARATAISE
jgi:hypothetical protein